MSPSVITLASSDTIEVPVFPLTNGNRFSHYQITCIDTTPGRIEHHDTNWPNPEHMVRWAYVLSSNNFDYNNRKFTPCNHNGTAFIQSVSSINGVDTVRVATSPSLTRVIVVYSSEQGQALAEPAVLDAIARGAMGLNLNWVRVMRQQPVVNDAPL